MPIEIRELIIKATVQQDHGSPGTGETKEGNNSVTATEEIIQASIEKIVEIIKNKHER